jgi:hypothetical protein
MLPIAMGWSGDPSFRAPMGIAVIGGLLASTALSLFVVPVIFTLTDDLQHRITRQLARFKTGADENQVTVQSPPAPQAE